MAYKIVSTDRSTGYCANVVVGDMCIALGVISHIMQKRRNVSCYITEEPVTHKNSFAAAAWLEVSAMLPVAKLIPPDPYSLDS